MEPENILDAFTHASENLGLAMLNLVAAWKLDGLSDGELLGYLSRIAEVRAAIAKRVEPK